MHTPTKPRSSEDNPRNLEEARTTIAKLKARLGLAEVPPALQPQARRLVPNVAGNAKFANVANSHAAPRVASSPLPAVGIPENLGDLAEERQKEILRPFALPQLKVELAAENAKPRKQRDVRRAGALYKAIRRIERL